MRILYKNSYRSTIEENILTKMIKIQGIYNKLGILLKQI